MNTLAGVGKAFSWDGVDRLAHPVGFGQSASQQALADHALALQQAYMAALAADPNQTNPSTQAAYQAWLAASQALAQTATIPVTGTAPTTDSTPYIIAGVVGVAVIGGLIYAATR